MITRLDLFFRHSTHHSTCATVRCRVEELENITQDTTWQVFSGLFMCNNINKPSKESLLEEGKGGGLDESEHLKEWT